MGGYRLQLDDNSEEKEIDYLNFRKISNSNLFVDFQKFLNLKKFVSACCNQIERYCKDGYLQDV